MLPLAVMGVITGTVSTFGLRGAFVPFRDEPILTPLPFLPEDHMPAPTLKSPPTLPTTAFPLSLPLGLVLVLLGGVVPPGIPVFSIAFEILLPELVPAPLPLLVWTAPPPPFSVLAAPLSISALPLTVLGGPFILLNAVAPSDGALCNPFVLTATLVGPLPPPRPISAPLPSLPAIMLDNPLPRPLLAVPGPLRPPVPAVDAALTVPFVLLPVDSLTAGDVLRPVLPPEATAPDGLPNSPVISALPGRRPTTPGAVMTPTLTPPLPRNPDSPLLISVPPLLALLAPPLLILTLTGGKSSDRGKSR
ncbi:hypothetical protein MTO96_040857 [Rhipicephalus appendiculatus]